MTGLFLNIFECKFEKEYFDLHYLPYEEYATKEAYKELREQNKDYQFYQYHKKLENGETNSRIYFWNRNDKPSTEIVGIAERIYTQENPKIASKIIESSIIQHFFNFGKFQVYRKKEEPFWSIISPKEQIPTIKDLGVYNRFHFNTFFYAHNEQLHFNFLISRNLKLKFKIGKQEFEKKGIECKDLKGFENNIFANKKSLERFLSATGQKGIYETKIKELEHNQEAFKKIKQVFDWLKNEREKIYLPNGNKFSEFSMKYLPLEENKIKADKLEEPIRYYFENKTQGGYYNDVISKLKPYTFKEFQKQDIQITIICPKFNEGILEGFVSQIETLLKNMFHIRPVFSNIFLENTKTESYADAVYEDKVRNSHLVIVVLNEEHKKILDIKQSPYFLCKAKLLGQGIATQDVQVKHIQKKNQFVMNNLALNMYAKIGGTGWTIQNIEKRKQELVIGVGSSINKEGKRVLGIAQVFRHDGKYLVGNCSPLSTFDNYAENLEKHLYSALSKAIDSTITNKKTEFRLIFHLFKSASKKYEIKAVENVIAKFQDKNLIFKYAFVHLAYGHNFRLFSNNGENNDIVKVFGKEKEVNITPKGTYIELTKHRSLVHFVKESIIPLEIEIDRRSTFEDLHYISTQVYWFSHLSHRTFLPSKKTVTILYPSIMSSLLDELQEVDDWDKKLAERITDKLWFI